jgi:hypothetical protein
MDFEHNPPYNNQCPSGNACIKFACVPVGSTLKIYTVSLALVREMPANASEFQIASNGSVETIFWDGTNGDHNPVSAGFYLYVIEGPNGRTIGKLAISRARNGF